MAEREHDTRRPEREWDRLDGRMPDGRRHEWAVADVELAAGEARQEAAQAEAGRVHARLSVGRQRVRAAEALERAPVNEALDAVLAFLAHDARLPAPTRHAAGFLGDLRARMLRDQLARHRARNQHLFRSPFECAGVLGFSLPEVERAFDTRSRDSHFWPLFQLFHTLLPPYAAPPAEDISLEDFVHSGAPADA